MNTCAKLKLNAAKSAICKAPCKRGFLFVFFRMPARYHANIHTYERSSCMYSGINLKQIRLAYSRSDLKRSKPPICSLLLWGRAAIDWKIGISIHHQYCSPPPPTFSTFGRAVSVPRYGLRPAREGALWTNSRLSLFYSTIYCRSITLLLFHRPCSLYGKCSVLIIFCKSARYKKNRLSGGF